MLATLDKVSPSNFFDLTKTGKKLFDCVLLKEKNEDDFCDMFICTKSCSTVLDVKIDSE